MLLDIQRRPTGERAAPPAGAPTVGSAPTGTPCADRPQPYLRAEGVVKDFGGARVLDGIDLAVGSDELVCLLGPSGCGKTTLLRILCGIEKPGAGRVWLQGEDITGFDPAERRFGIVFQSYALFPNLTALQNVGYGLRGTDRSRAQERARQMLDLVGLAAHMTKYPAQLSGGQQQRVALARALAPQPRLLLLDEPLSALDAQVRAALRGEIRRLQRQLRVPTVMVTHDQDEALALADRVVLMDAGRIAQEATPWELYARPADRFVAHFVGHMNLWSARVVGAGEVVVAGAAFAVQPADGACPTPAEGDSRALLGIRPEAIVIEPHDDAGARSPVPAPLPPNTVVAQLEDWTFCGAHLRLYWRAQQMQARVEVSVPTPAGRAIPWRPGDWARLRMPAAALTLLPNLQT